MTDLRLAIRTVARTPVFAVAVILTIALGVGATTAVFSVVYGVLYRPLPYSEPDRLVAVWQTVPRNPDARDAEVDAFISVRAFVSDRLLRSWQREARCFEEIGGYAPETFGVTAGGEAQQVDGAVVTSEVFKALRARPLLGRLFHPEDDPPTPAKVVVLAYGYWRQRFAGDPKIVGSTVRIDGAPYVVVGVLPADFRLVVQYGSREPALYTPISHQYKPGLPFAVMPGTIARLKPGIGVAAAQAEMTAVMRHLAESDRYLRGRGAFVVPLSGEAVETSAGTRPGLLTLLAATVCVLLIACVNVANLLLVRASTRHRELAVRAALGAGRWRIMRQMIVESLVLSVAGGMLGLLLAAWGTDVLLALMPANFFPRMQDVRIDGQVLGFGLAASAAVGVLAGLAPAWYAFSRDRRGTLTDAIKDGHRAGASGRGARLARRGLVAVEVVLAMVLLVGAGLLARTYVGLIRVDLGVRAERQLTFHLSFASPRYASAEARTAFVDDLLVRLRATPGVQTAGAASSLPLYSWLSSSTPIGVDGHVIDDRAPTVSTNSVTDGFFEAAGVSLVSGRFFRGTDARADVAVVNRTLLRRLWPWTADDGSGALGRTLTIQRHTYRIVGVVGDVKYAGPSGKIDPMVYVPFSSSPTELVSIVVHSAGDPMMLAPASRNIVRSLDADMAIQNVQSLEDVLATTVAPPRFRVVVIGTFALLALVLAVIGLYGVVAQSVVQRTQEIGIRLALGAGQRRIARMVLTEAVTLTAVGVLAGIAISAGASRVLSRFLFGVTPTDAATYALVAFALLAVAVVACLTPARRASAIDPVVALRNE